MKTPAELLGMHVVRVVLPEGIEFFVDRTATGVSHHRNLAEARRFGSLALAQQVAANLMWDFANSPMRFEAVTFTKFEYGIARDNGAKPGSWPPGMPWYRFEFFNGVGVRTPDESKARRWSEFLQCRMELNSLNMQQQAYAALGALPYQMWQWPIADEPVIPTRRDGPQGCVCTKCSERNEYAEPNQPDGSYICVSCRRYGRAW